MMLSSAQFWSLFLVYYKEFFGALVGTYTIINIAIEFIRITNRLQRSERVDRELRKQDLTITEAVENPWNVFKMKLPKHPNKLLLQTACHAAAYVRNLAHELMIETRSRVDDGEEPEFESLYSHARETFEQADQKLDEILMILYGDETE